MGNRPFPACWANALERMPLPHFELGSTLVGAESLVIYYKGASGMATEIFSSLQTGRLQNLPPVAVYRPIGRQHYIRSYSVRTNCGSYARSSRRTMK